MATTTLSFHLYSKMFWWDHKISQHCLTAVKRAVLNWFMASLVRHPPVYLPLCTLEVIMRLWMTTFHFVSPCPK